MSCKSCDKVAAEHRRAEYLKLKDNAISEAQKNGIKRIAIYLTKEGDMQYRAIGASQPAGSEVLEFISVGP